MSERKRVEGRLRGHRITRQPLREVMPAAEVNPWLWFAWDDDGDLLVAGVESRTELEREIAEDQR